MTNLIFLGPPGAGKGTQAMILAGKLGVPHISTGDILRQAIAEETPLGIEAKSYMDQGDLVPDQLILDLIKDRLSQEDTQKGWILDGFPRNVSQADFLATLLSQLNQDCDHVLNLDVPDDVLVQRLLARGRKDDKETTIRHRLEVYREQTAPLIDYYQKHSLLRQVNGNLPMEEVTKSLETIV